MTVSNVEEVRLASLSPKFLNLIVMPTEACNFRCTYCYETFEHSRMRPPVVAGIKALLDRRSVELTELAIDWFGGEPLLAADIITDISQHAIALAHERDFRFSAKITTNGYYLDGPRFAGCLANGIRHFQVSLDGDQKVHDESRKLISGAGTFDRLWSNITRISETPGDFSLLLRLHFTSDNYLSVAEFGRKLNATFGDDGRFQYAFKAIGRWGGPNDSQIPTAPAYRLSEIESFLWERSGLPHGVSEAHYPVCYAAMANSLVIRSTGHLAKCTVALTNGANDIGLLGADGDISVSQNKFRRWIAPLVEKRWDDAGCPLGSVLREASLAPLQE